MGVRWPGDRVPNASAPARVWGGDGGGEGPGDRVPNASAPARVWGEIVVVMGR